MDLGAPQEAEGETQNDDAAEQWLELFHSDDEGYSSRTHRMVAPDRKEDAAVEMLKMLEEFDETGPGMSDVEVEAEPLERATASSSSTSWTGRNG